MARPEGEVVGLEGGGGRSGGGGGRSGGGSRSVNLCIICVYLRIYVYMIISAY